jgi:uncharacterized protein (TIGR00255 family)
MTAYARITEEHNWGSISFELKSVNHRFLEVGFRMPESLRETETTLRDMARKKLGRGKIDCSVQIAFNRLDASSELDLEVAREHINIVESISAEITQPWPNFSCRHNEITRRTKRFCLRCQTTDQSRY